MMGGCKAAGKIDDQNNFKVHHPPQDPAAPTLTVKLGRCPGGMSLQATTDSTTSYCTPPLGMLLPARLLSVIATTATLPPETHLEPAPGTLKNRHCPSNANW